ncbi:MAG TPA: 23S rRNA (pseudouridine(1915)-N(3))-methyltransferase RlmH [Alphaproteobacteria bacterium]
MRMLVAAVGRAGRGPVQAQFDDYAKRLKPPLELIEVEERRPLPGPALKAREAGLLLGAVPAGALIVALDVRGKALSSEDLARRLADWRTRAPKALCFVIGGAEGLGEEVLNRADFVLSLGPMTWPHLLVRVMLAEQIYRAGTILAGHPYHRR